MIALAEQLNRFPRVVRYVRNATPLLSAYPDAHFDFVYSDIVLQHLDPADARAFVAEFIRVLRPRGLAVFQLPARRRPVEEQPGRPSHMPETAYRARIEPVHVPSELPTGARAECALRLQNASAVAWRQDTYGIFRAGNHWRDAAGTMLVQDDGRVSLPRTVEPGDTVPVTVPVQAPPDPGYYICEFDIVHEAISWFADRGSEAVQVRVRVGAVRSEAPPTATSGLATYAGAHPDIYSMLPPSSAAVGEFPMHGVDRVDVERLIHESGGTVVFVEPDERGGPEWEGYRYFARKLDAR
jgi:SAM-dependent methyltransferase